MNVDNIDRDLFGRNVRGAMYQPVDETLDKYKKAAYDIVRAAYDDNVVSATRTLPCTVVLPAYLLACDEAHHSSHTSAVCLPSQALRV